MSLPACSRSLAAKAAVSGRRTAGAKVSAAERDLRLAAPGRVEPGGGPVGDEVAAVLVRTVGEGVGGVGARGEGAPNTWDCTAEGELVALSWAVATVDLTRSSGAAPKQMLLWPPGGAWRRVVGRSVMTLPQFWSEPLAKALDDCETGVGMRGAARVAGLLKPLIRGERD